MGRFFTPSDVGEAPRWSDSLKLTPSLLLGVFTKPSISAHPSPLMRTGENVTLRCQSLLGFDKFILHQENSPGNFQRRGQMLIAGQAPADFSIGPMTLASAGTYRCYGSFSHSPYVWSAPSDPMDIIITGECGQTSAVCSLSQKVWCPVQHQYRERMTGVQRHSQIREREQTRERRCERRREKRTESLLCAKGKTQPVTDRRSKNVNERPTEKTVPEQG